MGFLSVHWGSKAWDLPMRLSVCGAHRRTSGWPVLDSPLTLSGRLVLAHRSLQAQVQDGTQAQVMGTCVPTSLFTSKLTLLKQTREKPPLCTQVELRGKSQTTHLHHPSLRTCSGRAWPPHPSPLPTFPTSCLPIPSPPNPCPNPGLFDPSSAEESTS